LPHVGFRYEKLGVKAILEGIGRFDSRLPIKCIRSVNNKLMLASFQNAGSIAKMVRVGTDRDQKMISGCTGIGANDEQMSLPKVVTWA
jgi:hypothetical protein